MRKTLALLALVALLLAFVLPVQAGQKLPVQADQELAVYYAGPASGVLKALQLAPDFRLVDSPAQADVLVLNGVISPEASERYRQGTGLVLILGPALNQAALASLLDEPVVLTLADQAASLSAAPGSAHGLLKDIVWNSAPQVRERMKVQLAGGQAIVASFESNEPVLWSLPRLESSVRGESFMLNAFLGAENPQLQEWPYFNYLIYNLVTRAAGQQPATFADYGPSPVPHAAERTVLIGLMAALLATAIGAFVLVWRYSHQHPELLDSLVSHKGLFAARQANTDWEEVGFHRPLGGFLVAFLLGLVLFIPLIIYQSLILPVYILPSAQALGIWGRVTQFFNLLWMFFDMGTGLAFVKFFSQYRVTDPRKAMLYGQVFVWWQALSGAVQVALIVIVASVYMPQTAYALYAWSVILHSIIQLPGFYTVVKHAFRGWQRFDYAQILDLATALVFPMIAQPVLVLLTVAWGRANPAFGQAMGGLLGMGLAAYATEVLTFLVGLRLYRRLGYNTRLLFLAHFDWQTVKSAFRFGVFEMLGSSAWAAGQAIEILITQTRLVNYTEIWGNWVLAQNFIFGFNVTATLCDNLMPSISESISNAYRKLSQYYTVMAYKWGGMINGFIAAVLLAVTDRFILGATGPEFSRAASYAIPLILWGAIQYPSWVGDSVQTGSNRPYLKTALVIGEQVVRIGLAYALIARFQIYALIIAYFAGLLAKDLAGYFINHRLCFPQRFYFWQSLGAPLLAGAAHYAVLRYVTGLIWQGDPITSILIFLIGILFSFPLYAFFYGLAGGWDDDTLGELAHAVRLSSFMRPMAWLFWYANALGARISPLHGLFPITIRAAAMAEADQLTCSRVLIGGEKPADDGQWNEDLSLPTPV